MPFARQAESEIATGPGIVFAPSISGVLSAPRTRVLSAPLPRILRMSTSAVSQTRPAAHRKSAIPSSVPSCGSRPNHSGHHWVNVGSTERQVSVLSGAALVLTGLSHGRLSGLLLSLAGGGLLYRGLTGHCYTYQALGINAGEKAGNTVIPARSGTKVDLSVTVNRPIGELYSFWRNLKNLPGTMRHLKSVELLDGNRSRWVAEGPMGLAIEWEAEIFNEREAELIAWRSLPGSQVDTTGSVRFKELANGRGTSVTVSLKYDPPGGKVGTAIEWLMGSDAEQQIDEDLRKFKSRMEAGEIPTVEGQSSGRR